MKQSESIKEITLALINFSADVGKIKKDSVNPFFKSKYADLSSILDAIKEPLLKNSLAVVQFPINEGELMTMVMHTSGEWIKGSFVMRPTKNDPQGLGSVITYQRRYALGAILGLNIDDDDDGNRASRPVAKMGAKVDVNACLNKFTTAKTLSDLAAVWEAFTPAEKSTPQILAKKDELKTILK